VGIRVIASIQQPSHHFLQTFRPLRMFKIVFRDSLTFTEIIVFVLPAMAEHLSSACAERIGCTTNFCSMIKLLHELKNSSC